MATLFSKLASLHSNLIRWRWAQLFTAFTRCLLALGFIPPSLPKILHKPFTGIGIDDPVGAYFKALYDTGYYYDFIGLYKRGKICCLEIRCDN
ncbi:MAG: hypothetical protein ABI844_16905 [Saprospiraceae bacterium]